MQHTRGWWVAAGGFGLLGAVYAVADDVAVREGAWILLVAGACAAVLLGVRRHHPHARRPWLMLAAGFGMLSVGGLHHLPRWPDGGLVDSLGMLIEVLAFPLIGLAAYGMVRRQAPTGDREGAVDGAIVLVAIATVLAGTVFTPEALEVTSATERAFLVVAPLVLAGVATAALRLVFVGERVTSTYLLVGSACLALVGHVLRTSAQAAGTHTPGSWADLLVAAAYAGAGLAALHPSMPRLARPVASVDGQLTLSRLTVLGGSLLTPPVALLLTRQATVVPLAASVLVSTLVLLRLWRLVVDREAVRDELREQALHDALTGLPNRIELLRRLRRALRDGGTAGTVTAVLFIDLDGFKQVNDDFGHRAGDDTLVAVGARLSELSRAEDVLGRLAGDEFVLVCDGIDEADVDVVAGRVLTAFAEPFRVPVADVMLGASIGVAVDRGGGRTAEQLLSEADAAMYRAKRRGGGWVERFGAELGAQMERRRRLELDLAGAIARGELHLLYQPVVRLTAGRAQATDEVAGAEALLRWMHPALGRIEADEILPIAESSGLVVPIGRWVAEEACRQLGRWRSAARLAPGFRLFLNTSARQLLHAELPAELAAIVAAAGIDAGDVVVEFPEAAVLGDRGDPLVTLQGLRRAGFAIAIDDFGTSYASLTHLKRLPLDLIKIDGAFVDDIVSSRDDQAIVAALVGIARQLGARIVAEGVESEAQREALRALGCDFVQGYHVGPPASAEGLRLGEPDDQARGQSSTSRRSMRLSVRPTKTAE